MPYSHFYSLKKTEVGGEYASCWAEASHYTHMLIHRPMSFFSDGVFSHEDLWESHPAADEAVENSQG